MTDQSIIHMSSSSLSSLSKLNDVDSDYEDDDYHKSVACLWMFIRALRNYEPNLIDIVVSRLGLMCDNCDVRIVLWDTYHFLELSTVDECVYYNISRDVTSPLGCPIYCDICMNSRCHGDIEFCCRCYRDMCNGCGCGCGCDCNY